MGEQRSEAATPAAWLIRFTALLPFLASAWWWRAGTFSDSGRVPIGHDAFFHARRALDWAGGGLVEFDTRVHAPEGSWILPWAWDSLLGALVVLSRALGLDELELAFALPALVGALNLLLCASIARRLGASDAMAIVATIGLGVSPAFVQHHAFGAIDHHAAELGVVLVMLWLACRMAERPAAGTAMALGMTLGFAHAVHPGLFVWHLPLAIAAALAWWLRSAWPRPWPGCIALGLLLGLALAAIPSQSVRAGLFRYDVFSLFHVWITVLTAAGLLALQALRPTPRSLLVLIVAGAIGLLPLLAAARDGLRFLGTDLEFFSHLSEARGLLPYLAEAGVIGTLRYLGPVIVVGPLALLWLLLRRLGGSAAGLLIGAIFVLASLLGLSQVRFVYLLLPALWIALACAASALSASRGRGYRVALCVVLAAAIALPLPMQLNRSGIGGDRMFAESAPFWKDLRPLCADAQPTILAEPVFGHFIHFFSDCRTLASNLITSPRHEQNVRRVYALLALPPAALPDAAPDIDFVLVRRRPVGSAGTDVCAGEGVGARLICDQQVPGYRLRAQIAAVGRDGKPIRLLGLFEIERADRGQAIDAQPAGPRDPVADRATGENRVSERGHNAD